MHGRWALIATLFLAALALAGCGSSVGKLNNQGNEAFAEQDYQGALAAYQQAEEDAPQVAEPHYNAANTHYRTEDYEQAQQEIEQALVGEPQQEGLDQNSYYNLGNALFQSGQFKAAIEAYKEALRLNPADLQAKQNLELALRQLQQQEQQQDQQQQADQQDEQQEGQQDQQQQADQQDQQQQEGQQDDQQQQGQQQQAGQQDEQQQQGQEGDQQQDGQEDEQQQADQAGGQPQQMTGLSKEQARQLFEAAARGAESLEEFLQQILVVPGAPPREDW
jgi:Ca-activated chloride channel family protein